MKKITLVGALFGLLFATTVFADIISGLSTSNISTDITVTQLNLNKPSTSAIGDFLLANVSVNGGTTENITAPAGWTLIQRTNNSNTVAIASFWKKVEASEPPTYTWTISPQTKAAGGITAFSGVDTMNPIDSAADATGRGTAATAPALVRSANNDQVVALFASNFGKNNTGAFSTTPGMIKLYDAKNTPSGPTTAAEDKTEASAGLSGPFAVTISNTFHEWAAQTLALKMALPDLSGAVAYWKLDGNSLDSVGSNNGSDSNIAYSISDGKVNSGANFDGINSSIDLGNIISGITDFSICSWVKTSDAVGGHIIFGQRDNSSTDGQFLFGMVDGKLYIFTYDDVHTYGYADVTYSNTGFADNNWHFVCFTSNGISGTFYLDGTQDGTLIANSTVTFSSSILGEIGYDRRDGNSRWSGGIDEVAFWSRALSSAEINLLYNGGQGLQYPF
jgi:hypothetical protein